MWPQYGASGDFERVTRDNVTLLRQGNGQTSHSDFRIFIAFFDRNFRKESKKSHSIFGRKITSFFKIG